VAHLQYLGVGRTSAQKYHPALLSKKKQNTKREKKDASSMVHGKE
jgi:hypothetical protein